MRVAILASGTGSNAKSILQYFQDHQTIQITLIGSNRTGAGVLEIADKMGVDTYSFSNSDLRQGDVLETFRQKKIDFIILAGFLALVPLSLVHAYENRILNIHPALLPKYGGKGMYGHHVHAAVKEQNENHSGMTIHLVNPEFDKGKIIFQAAIKLSQEDTPEDIQKKVLVLEHQYYAGVVESYIHSMSN